jgi:hypothetical protein
MEINACYSGPSWCHMLEEGGDARGMPYSVMERAYIIEEI